ncbi:MAG: glutamyl-tRNA reductase, partial [Thermomicrobium sp.]|nr:glutamyl-tRNA reductase [Thermomicrobium sp.]
MLTVVAITHRTAPLPIRERLGLSPDTQVEWLRRWCGQAAEMALLVTCHRAELYWIAERSDAEDGLRWLSEASALPVETLASVAFVAHDRTAVHHLMRVAAGLDSRVVGETQILGQVRRARETARAAGTLGPALDRLFSLSLAAGRAARARTGLGAGGQSLARLAVDLVLTSCHGRDAWSVLVLGAGEMGRLVIDALRRERPSVLYVSNRTAARLCGMHDDGVVRVVAWQQWREILERVDAVVVTTAAPTPILHAWDFAPSTRMRLVVDLAVPRNVDPVVAQVPGVRLVTVDDLRQEATSALRLPHARAEAIVERFVDRYVRWWRMRPLGAEIRNAQAALERLCRRELRRAFTR